jgi:hypothetical protein
MLGEPKNQFSLTRAAPSTGGRAKANSYQFSSTNSSNPVSASNSLDSIPERGFGSNFLEKSPEKPNQE